MLPVEEFLTLKSPPLVGTVERSIKFWEKRRFTFSNYEKYININNTKIFEINFRVNKKPIGDALE
jgi:hypothetical protein